jgi:hypothetical protein
LRRKINEEKGSAYLKFDLCLDCSHEFQIELFNPEYYSIMAKIKIQGEFISNSGIIIRPGQRIYLERYLDSNNKFKFVTYNIENTTHTQHIIDNNGKIEVFFYKKDNLRLTYTSTSADLLSYKNFDNSVNLLSFDNSISSSVNNSILTGSIENGVASSQQFEEVYENFSSLVYHKVIMKIIPKENKPVEYTSIRNYCSNCGAKLKHNYRYCPTCGSKI